MEKIINDSRLLQLLKRIEKYLLKLDTLNDIEQQMINHNRIAGEEYDRLYNQALSLDDKEQEKFMKNNIKFWQYKITDVKRGRRALENIITNSIRDYNSNASENNKININNNDDNVCCGCCYDYDNLIDKDTKNNIKRKIITNEKNIKVEIFVELYDKKLDEILKNNVNIVSSWGDIGDRKNYTRDKFIEQITKYFNNNDFELLTVEQVDEFIKMQDDKYNLIETFLNNESKYRQCDKDNMDDINYLKNNFIKQITKYFNNNDFELLTVEQVDEFIKMQDDKYNLIEIFIKNYDNNYRVNRYEKQPFTEQEFKQQLMKFFDVDDFLILTYKQVEEGIEKIKVANNFRKINIKGSPILRIKQLKDKIAKDLEKSSFKDISMEEINKYLGITKEQFENIVDNILLPANNKFLKKEDFFPNKNNEKNGNIFFKNNFVETICDKIYKDCIINILSLDKNNIVLNNGRNKKNEQFVFEKNLQKTVNKNKFIITIKQDGQNDQKIFSKINDNFYSDKQAQQRLKFVFPMEICGFKKNYKQFFFIEEEKIMSFISSSKAEGDIRNENYLEIVKALDKNKEQLEKISTKDNKSYNEQQLIKKNIDKNNEKIKDYGKYLKNINISSIANNIVGNFIRCFYDSETYRSDNWVKTKINNISPIDPIDTPAGGDIFSCNRFLPIMENLWTQVNNNEKDGDFIKFLLLALEWYHKEFNLQYFGDNINFQRLYEHILNNKIIFMDEIKKTILDLSNMFFRKIRNVMNFKDQLSAKFKKKIINKEEYDKIEEKNMIDLDRCMAGLVRIKFILRLFYDKKISSGKAVVIGGKRVENRNRYMKDKFDEPLKLVNEVLKDLDPDKILTSVNINFVYVYNRMHEKKICLPTDRTNECITNILQQIEFEEPISREENNKRIQEDPIKHITIRKSEKDRTKIFLPYKLSYSDGSIVRFSQETGTFPMREQYDDYIINETEDYMKSITNTMELYNDLKQKRDERKIETIIKILSKEKERLKKQYEKLNHHYCKNKIANEKREVFRQKLNDLCNEIDKAIGKTTEKDYIERIDFNK